MSGGRPKDMHYWNQVEKLQNGGWQCKRCQRKFKGGVSRIRAHLDRIQGQGITPCSVDPLSVAHNEGLQVHNNTISGFSNPQGDANAMNSSPVAGNVHEMNAAGSSHHQNNIDPINLLEGFVTGDTLIRSGNNNVLESEVNNLKESVHDLTCEEDDIKEQLLGLESQGKKRKDKVDDWLEEVRNLKRRAVEMNNKVNQFGSADMSALEVEIQQLTKEVRWRKKQKPLVLSNELVGYGFELDIKKVWELLGDDQVFIIGIYGMGGVGKTTLVTHLKNEIKRKDTFKHVFLVTLSLGFSIHKLQHDIAGRIGVRLDEEDDELLRAEKLSLALEAKEKAVLILDDVWKYIDLQKVGIPLRVNGLKLILTTRLEHVCHQMDCQTNNIIQMKPLADEEAEEAWELFLLKLGYNGTPATLPSNVLKVARSAAKKCNGLPLGISVLARTMKGVNDIHQWRHALNKLRNSGMEEEMEEEVFKVLKLSYDNLIDKNLQHCFLCCTLFDEMSKEELIMKLVDEGLINGMRSLEEIFDEGLAILNKLTGHSLLLKGFTRFYMHSLVRDMACHILKLKESHRYMVKCGKELKKIPDMQEWKAELEKVTLVDNNIEEIPASTSPYCPRLSTLVLGWNPFSRIPDCFFTHMNSLAILDFSYNEGLICLPNSLSNLGSLVSLLLRGCYSLEYVPPLGELHALSRLVILGTSIQDVPQGLEMLINLKWLDLSRNNSLTWPLASSVLPSLTNMQYLDLRAEKARVKVEDLQRMNLLEWFAGCFHECDDFNDYVQIIQDRGCGPKTYCLSLGIIPSYPLQHYIGPSDEIRRVSCGDCEQVIHLLPRDLVELNIQRNKQWRCLCNALSFNGPSSLSYCRIYKCPKVESLFCLSCSCYLCSNLQNLENLFVYDLESLTVIWKNEEDITQSLPLRGGFSHLKHLYIWRCHKIERLLTTWSSPRFHNLTTIEVRFCYSMKEIFVGGSTEEDNAHYTEVFLPKLEKLELRDLPKLKTVWRGIIVCNSSPKLDIFGCPNMERYPTVRVSKSLSCDSDSDSH